MRYGGLSTHDIELMRELYRPTDGGFPLVAREIADKFEVTLSRVYDALHMSEARLAFRRALEKGARNGSG